MKINDIDKFERFGLARELVSRGLRTMPTASLTGLTAFEVRELFRLLGIPLNVYGRTITSNGLCQNRTWQIRWSLFAAIYSALGGKKVKKGVDAETLIKSFDLFKALNITDEISMTDAWVIAHEIKSQNVELAHCRTCSLKYLKLMLSDRFIGTCPYCKLNGRSGERSSGRHAVH
jgi:hypothetical protein